jgi:hypothetical protein
VRVAPEARARHLEAARGGVPLARLVVCARPLQAMVTVLEQTLTAHHHRVCHSGEGPRRLRMPSDTNGPTRPTRRPCVH